MKYRVTLNNRVYEVEVEEGSAVLLNEYEAASPAPAAVSAPAPKQESAPAPAPPGDGNAVKAPMPGNILKISVTVGQKVSEGETLLVLEAMKMENEVTADRSGTVTGIIAAKGQTVETGDPLVVIS